MNKSRKVGISILSFNNYNQIKNLLEAIFEQDLNGIILNVDILDSSTDDSTSKKINRFIKDKIFIRYIKIVNLDFSHGKTRQLAIERAINRKEEFLIFIVQDAIPISNQYVKNHINSHDLDPLVAIVFGKQVPYPNHSILTKATINSVFDSLSPNDEIVYHRKGSNQIGTYFNSNVNASYKLNHFINGNLKFESVDYAEDQKIAKLAIDLNYIKIYNPNCCVIHSHDYTSFIDHFQRFYDDYNGVDMAIGTPGDHVSIKTFVPKFLQTLTHNLSLIKNMDISKWDKFTATLNAFPITYARVLALYASLSLRYNLSPNFYNKIKIYFSREAKIKAGYSKNNFIYRIRFWLFFIFTPLILPILTLTKSSISRKNKGQNISTNQKKEDIFKHEPTLKYIDNYYFNSEKEIQKENFLINKNLKKISWIIPDFSFGGGGHMIIFYMAKELEKKGLASEFFIFPPFISTNPTDALNKINTKYVPLKKAAVTFLNKEKRHNTKSELLFLTDWNSYYYSYLLKGHQTIIHFIQDYEPFFFPKGTNYILAEIAFRNTKYFISNSIWLYKLMTTKNHKTGNYIKLGYDHSIYYCKNKWSDREFSIAFYSRNFTERRSVGLGILILKQIIKLIPSIKVYFFGGNDDLTEDIPQFINCGILSYEELAQLYNKCKVGIVFSATNYSIIPQEMNACGLPVIDLEYDGNQVNYDERSSVILLPFDLKLMVKKLYEILMDDKYLEKISLNAPKEVENLTWEIAGDKFYKSILEIIDLHNADQSKLT